MLKRTKQPDVALPVKGTHLVVAPGLVHKGSAGTSPRHQYSHVAYTAYKCHAPVTSVRTKEPDVALPVEGAHVVASRGLVHKGVCWDPFTKLPSWLTIAWTISLSGQSAPKSQMWPSQ